MQPVLKCTGNLKPSGNKVLEGTLNGRSGFFKVCTVNYPPKLAQIDVAMSAYYRLVLGKKAAASTLVTNSEGTVVGSFSYSIPDFQSMETLAPDAERMIRCGIADMLVASYVREENDLHAGNIGIEGKIDYDESAYSITSEIKGERYVSGILVPRPKDAFSITTHDIENFPVIKDAVPCHWPTYQLPGNMNVQRTFSNRDAFIALKDDPRFKKKKYFAFFKEIVIDRFILNSTFSRSIADQDLNQQLVKHFSQRIKVLRKILLVQTEFPKIMYNHPSFLKKVLAWFKNYNETEDAAGQQIDLKRIRSNSLSVWRDSFYRQVISELINLRIFINRVSMTESDVISSLERFNQLFISTLELFFSLEVLNDVEIEQFIDNCIQFLLEYKDVRFKKHENTIEWMNSLDKFAKLIQKFHPKRCDNGTWKVQSLNEFSADLPLISQSRLFVSAFENLQPLEVVYTLQIDHVKTMARSLKRWILDEANATLILKIAKESLDAYRPTFSGSYAGYLNLYTYTRTRTDEIETLIRDLEVPSQNIYRTLMQFLSRGKWNTGFSESFNVTFVKKLCRTMIKAMTEKFTLSHLLQDVAIVQATHDIMNGIVQVEDKLESIYKEMIRSNFQGFGNDSYPD